MIQPLRTAHRRVFVSLAVVLPLILLVGLWARRPLPEGEANGREVPPSARLLGKGDALWQRHKVKTEIYGEGGNPQNFYVVLHSSPTLNEPDLLLYLVTSTPQGNAVPPQSRFLGPVVPGTALAFHLDGQRIGRLVLYSGARQSVVDIAVAENLP